jgi:hypothetical protein
MTNAPITALAPSALHKVSETADHEKAYMAGLLHDIRYGGRSRIMHSKSAPRRVHEMAVV